MPASFRSVNHVCCVLATSTGAGFHHLTVRLNQAWHKIPMGLRYLWCQRELWIETLQSVFCQEFNTTHCHIVRCQHRETRFWQFTTFQSSLAKGRWWGSQNTHWFRFENYRLTIWDSYKNQPFPWDVSFWVLFPFRNCDSDVTSSFLAFLNVNFSSFETHPQPCTLLKSASLFQLWHWCLWNNETTKTDGSYQASTYPSSATRLLRIHLHQFFFLRARPSRGQFVQRMASV